MDVDSETDTDCGIQSKRISPQLDLRPMAQMSHAVTYRTRAER